MRFTQLLRTAARQATRPTAARAPAAFLISSSPAAILSSPRTASAPISTPLRAFSATHYPRAGISTYSIGELSDREFQDTAESTLERLTDYLEDKLEELDVPGSDIEYSTSVCGKSGVLTVKLGDKGTYVVNKQPPNKQIWLSSPISGPKRYDYDKEHRVWFYHRDGDLFHDLLTRELRVLLEDPSIEVDLKGEE